MPGTVERRDAVVAVSVSGAGSISADLRDDQESAFATSLEFKAFSEHDGHSAGDTARRQVARAVEKCVRRVSRLSGSPRGSGRR